MASGNKMPANGWRKRQIMQWIPEEKGVIDKSAAKRIATLLEWQPKREWVGLTEEEIDKAWEWAQKSSPHGVTRIEVFTKSIEAKLREKNGA
jgi:hypothetical protein